MDLQTYRFKRRNYLHFDLPLSEREAKSIVSSPSRVASNSFYPFLGYTMETLRIRKENDGTFVKRPKQREIKISAHRDAAIYSYYGHLLADLYEQVLRERKLSDAVKAFRSLPAGGTNVDFAAEVFNFIDGKRPCVALAFDIEKFFDTLAHAQIKASWENLLGEKRLPPDHFAIFRSLTDYAWVDRERAYKTFDIGVHNPKRGNRRRICTAREFRDRVRGNGLLQFNPRPAKGIPQGSPISAILSNLYMLDFDWAVNEAVTACGGLYRRYCDDIMIVVSPDRENVIENVVQQQIQKVALTLSAEKTDRAAFSVESHLPAPRPIQYLGFTYDGVRRLLRLSSLSRYYGKMRRGVALAKRTQRKHNRNELRDQKTLTPLRRRKLYIQYSYLIKRRTRLKGASNPKSQSNFLTYAYRAAQTLGAPEIRSQVRRHWTKLRQEMEKPISGQLSPAFSSERPTISRNTEQPMHLSTSATQCTSTAEPAPLPPAT